IDLFAPFARVTVRRMFSGHAVYRDGVVFALAIRAGLFLKCDGETAPLFEAEGLDPFVYATARGTTTITSYRRLPDACLDDEDELRRWSSIAWQAALRAPRKSPGKRLRRPSTD
ncbi:MAG: TfoX/Sxy family protein, partial [Phreatobacter sp.]|nr:TfoX/Sxy family protein [Phreatobacter sp.]